MFIFRYPITHKLFLKFNHVILTAPYNFTIDDMNATTSFVTDVVPSFSVVGLSGCDF